MERFFIVLSLVCVAAPAQTNRYNFDEKKIPPYTLPDPLKMENGEKVTSAAMWNEKRRPELLALFADQVYGKTPAVAAEQRVSEVITDRKALGGKAIRKQLTIYFTLDNAGPQLHLLIYV